MQKLCCNNMAVPPGKIVYTGMLNNSGGYVTDCIITRLAQDRWISRLGRKGRDKCEYEGPLINVYYKNGFVRDAHILHTVYLRASHITKFIG